MVIRNDFNFGQHFLVDITVQAKLLSEIDLPEKDIVIEIDPGKGVLSTEMTKRVKHLICIEIDKTMKPYSDALQPSHININVIYGNVLTTKFPHCTKIISNLPFSIVEPFLYG